MTSFFTPRLSIVKNRDVAYTFVTAFKQVRVIIVSKLDEAVSSLQHKAEWPSVIDEKRLRDCLSKCSELITQISDINDAIDEIHAVLDEAEEDAKSASTAKVDSANGGFSSDGQQQ